jgi:uncharacterized membrane protein YqgA involved in biofilm formation
MKSWVLGCGIGSKMFKGGLKLLFYVQRKCSCATKLMIFMKSQIVSLFSFLGGVLFVRF